MSMQQGKNKTANDYTLQFETVLEKITHYDESWVRNLFMLGLHSHLATQVNMQNPAMLNRAIKLAKKADVAIQMNRRSGASGSGSSQQKVKPTGPKPNITYTGQPRGSYYRDKKQKQNRIFYYRKGQSSGNLVQGRF